MTTTSSSNNRTTVTFLQNSLFLLVVAIMGIFGLSKKAQQNVDIQRLNGKTAVIDVSALLYDIPGWPPTCSEALEQAPAVVELFKIRLVEIRKDLRLAKFIFVLEYYYPTCKRLHEAVIDPYLKTKDRFIIW